MTKMHLSVFSFICLVAFSAEVSAKAEPQICRKLANQINRIDGMWLGMHLESFPFTEKFVLNKPEKNSSEAEYYAKQYELNSLVMFSAEKQKIKSFQYQFEHGKFKDASEMSYYVSIWLGLPIRAWGGEGRSRYMNCRNFELQIYEGDSKNRSRNVAWVKLKLSK